MPLPTVSIVQGTATAVGENPATIMILDSNQDATSKIQLEEVLVTIRTLLLKLFQLLSK